MNKLGLLEEPEFDNISKYLSSGKRTEITENIRSIVNKITGNTDGLVVRNILLWINQNTKRIHSGRDPRKFKRSADEILKSGERTGCCDSSTLFTAIARAKGIPTMQILTLDKEWGKAMDRGENIGTEGHFYVGCFLKDVNGNGNWALIDSDTPMKDLRDLDIRRLNKDNRNISKRRYAFAYTRDYSDIDVEGLKIDSINSMARVQRIAYKMCDREDFKESESKSL